VVLLAVAFAIAVLATTWLHKSPAVGSRDMLIDEHFGIPRPPRDMPYHQTATLVTIAWTGLLAIVGLVIVIRDSITRRSPLPLFIMLSMIAVAIPEVFVDVLGGVYFVDGPHLQVFTIMGRDMGLFVFSGWTAFGFVPYVMFRVLERNPPTRILWLLVALVGLGELVFEELMLLGGCYHYYGNQPLVVVHQLPWWWIPCNTIGCFFGAALAYRLRESLQGWRGLAMLVITPAAMLGVYAFIAMPSFIAVNAAYSWPVTQLLGMMTIVLGVAVFALIVSLVLNRSPFALDDSEPRTSRA
jgi:hypothetical protein